MANMETTVRDRISQLGRQGKTLEGQVLKQAGESLAKGIESHINRSSINSAGYVHLQDSIKVSRTKSDTFGRRYVDVGPSKDKAFILRFLEIGTSKMSPQLPVTKGNATARDDVRRILGSGIKRLYRL